MHEMEGRTMGMEPSSALFVLRKRTERKVADIDTVSQISIIDELCQGPRDTWCGEDDDDGGGRIKQTNGASSSSSE